VPEDLYNARAHRLVSRSVAMMRRETAFNDHRACTGSAEVGAAGDEMFALAMGGGVVHA
jgi:hypothetical protein